MSPTSSSDWLGLGGARVLVTGAAGGIGAAVQQAFLEVGARVVGTDVVPTEDPLTTFFVRDLRAPGVASQLVDEAAAALGGLDVVAHMAGVLRRQHDLGDVDERDWDDQHDVNLKASFFLLRQAGQRMVAQGSGGRLVAAASQSWITGGSAGSVAYAASKGGLVSMCRGLAKAFGAAGVTVNTVAPGAIETPMLRSGLPASTYERIVDDTPLGRLGTPDEVAAVVLFLASARAAFVSAATINVSGGWLAY